MLDEACQDMFGYLGAGVGPSDDGEHHAVVLRVLPGFREATERLVGTLNVPVFVRVVEVEDSAPRPSVVASAWMQKIAFNKENPTDLLMQLEKVLEKAQKEAEGIARTRLRSVSTRIRGLGRDVQEAWRRRQEN
jgi:hypothetical protein